MKSVLLIISLFTGSNSFAQNKVVGKWKPVTVVLGNVLSVDVKAGKSVLSDTADVIFKNDKDPAESKKMMQFMGEMLIEKMKNAEEEFQANGTYVEYDTKQSKLRKGAYTFDASKNKMVLTQAGENQVFIVSFKGNRMILSGKLGVQEGSKDDIVIEYEKL